MPFLGTWEEAGHEHSNKAFGLQPFCNLPGWNDVAVLHQHHPGAGELIHRNGVRFSTSGRAQVSDRVAIDVILAERERRHPVRKTLGALTDRRIICSGEVERRLSRPVETAALLTRAFPRSWCE